jgi:acetyltransferase-like isoleucine patch superfamily enzyme
MQALNGIKKLVKKILKRDKPYFIHPTASVNANLLVIGKHSKIYEYVIIREQEQAILTLGDYVQIGPFCVIFPDGGITIGNNVLIGPHCVFAASNHDYIQTKVPVRFSGAVSKGPIVIEDSVWIGANCTVTDGVTIGHNAVIGANSVITKNVQPYEIVGGTPARHLGFRKTEHGE